jgi:hypothetical protein
MANHEAYYHRQVPSEISVEYVDRDFPPPGYREVRHFESGPHKSDNVYSREYRDRSSSHNRSRSHSTRRQGDGSHVSRTSSTAASEEKEKTKPKNDTLLAVSGALAGTALAVSAGKWAIDRARAKSQDRTTDDSEERSVSRGRRRYSVSEHQFYREHEDGTSMHHHYRSRSRVEDDDSEKVNERDWEADEKKARHLKHKQMLMGGLAAVATIHAAHLTYRGHEARKNRKQAVEEGNLDRKEARKMERHAAVQDLESIGVAVFAIKNAVRTFKETSDVRIERKELKEERLLRQRGDERSSRSRSRPRSFVPRNRHDLVYTSGDDGA